jgi:peroxiredoxin
MPTDPLDLRRCSGALLLVTHRGDWCPFCCGQLVRLAAEQDAFHRRGAEIVAVGADAADRSEALARRWSLPFPVIADPDGSALLKPLQLWNPDEHDGIAAVGTVVFAPDGREVWRSLGRDVADRPDHETLFAVLDELELPPISPERFERPPAADDDDEDGDRWPEAFPTWAFNAYFEGAQVTAGSLARRFEGGDRDEAKAVGRLAKAYVEAWKSWRS